MRIKCGSVDDFIRNLDGESVFLNSVYINKAIHPLNGDRPGDATSWEVIIQCTAVLDYGEDGQALLECGEVCGVDRVSQPQSEAGTERFARLRARLSEVCDRQGLKIKPGVLDI